VHVTVRPLVDADVDAARTVQTEAFAAHDRLVGDPVPELTEERVERQRRRLRHFLRHDAPGSWVAEADGQVVGVALASRRGSLWGLSLLVVDPAVQSRGIGRRLLDATLTYAEPTGPAVILSSRDARAMHRYASAGFDLHPQIRATGIIAADHVPAPSPRVRLGTADDHGLADAVDLVVRGAARGPDHGLISSYAEMLVVDGGGSGLGRSRGYAYRSGGVIETVVGTDDDAASALLQTCLARMAAEGIEVVVEHVNGAQQWAVRLIVAAGLTITPSGPVFWRGRQPPAGYLPSGPYL
jgi:GNAT superfamily N-acetyltransferase